MNALTRLRLWQIDAIGAGVCALLALAWYGAGLAPLAEAKAARLTKLSELEQREKKAASVDQAVRTARQDLAKKQEEIKGSIPLQQVDQATRRQGKISGLARAHHLGVDEVKPGTPVPGARFTTVPIVLTGSGQASNCAAFLHELRKQFPDVGVAAFKLQGEPENPDKPARFTFNFVWYAAPAPGTPTK